MANRQIITANRTADGSVVYLRADRTWTPALTEARTFDEESIDQRDALLAWAAAEEQREVCDPYAMTVDVGPDGPVPLSARERIRAAGPIPVLQRWGYAS